MTEASNESKESAQTPHRTEAPPAVFEVCAGADIVPPRWRLSAQHARSPVALALKHASHTAMQKPVQQAGADVDLIGRHASEASFHDHKYATHSTFPRHYRANPTYPVFARMLALLGADLSSKTVLEYGCGDGWITSELARRGASVCAFDISPEAVAQTQHAVRKAGMSSRCDVQVMAGEHLRYPAGSFDMAVGFAILHHLEIERALGELHRVLKPGGRAFFAEPLASNPLIRLYRRMTPQFRTPDEVPIDLDRFAAQVGGFTDYTHREQLLLASGAVAFCYVPGLCRAAKPVQRWLMRIDDLVLRAVPAAGRWAWYSILTFRK
jgi:SAM-dependent methyltransferase